ncbi:Arginase, catabolizes arginine to ornithine and urea [Collariella sp. IMI 366227]|nr:Arginase, catabolizes arginine to ornithine and urea [Collariella sp. IMI 366227]
MSPPSSATTRQARPPPPNPSTTGSVTGTTGTITPFTTSPRFFGKPLNTSMITSKFLSHPEDLGVVAVGFSGGQGKPGVDAAPTALIENGLLSQLRDELGYNLYGHDAVHSYSGLVPKDDPPHRGMKNPRAVSAVTRKIKEQVYEQAREGRMFDIDRHGIGRVMEMALAHIGSDTPIHLSFDVDALDPMWAPSTGTPVRGGLTLREGDYICECVHQTGSLVAVDLVEVNPHLAPEIELGGVG